jgi:hypothetical protein
LHQKIVEQKTANRFLFWDIANSGFVEHPVLGNGFNNYIYTYHDYFKKDFYESQNNLELWTNQPHSVFWEYLSTTGMVGTVSFLILLVTVFYLFYVRNGINDQDGEKYSILKIIIAGGLVGYFVHNLFGFDVPVTYLLLFIIIGIGMGVSPYLGNMVMPNRYHLKQIFGIKMMVLGILMIVFLGILPWQESKQWRMATGKSNIINDFQILETLQQRSVLGGVADSAFLIDTFFNRYQRDIIEHVQKTGSFGVLENVENFLEREVVRQPNNFRARLVLAKIITLHMVLDSTAIDLLWGRASEHVRIAQQLNSQSPDPHVVMGNVYILKNNFSQARASIRAGIALATEYEAGYEAARNMNAIIPDADFKRYVESMEKRWRNP